MAVLIEGIAVVVRRDAISTSFAGGWTAFKEVVRGMIYCADDELACVHFTSGVNTDAFLATLGNKRDR